MIIGPSQTKILEFFKALPMGATRTALNLSELYTGHEPSPVGLRIEWARKICSKLAKRGLLVKTKLGPKQDRIFFSLPQPATTPREIPSGVDAKGSYADWIAR